MLLTPEEFQVPFVCVAEFTGTIVCVAELLLLHCRTLMLQLRVDGDAGEGSMGKNGCCSSSRA